MKKKEKSSASQLATIEALNREILKFGNEINRPYAVLASLFMTPLVLNILYMQEWSPLYESYMQAVKDRYNYYIQYIDNMGEDFNQNFVKFNNRIKIFGHTKEYIQECGYDETDDFFTILRNSDSILLGNKAGCSKFTISQLKYLKECLFSIYQNVYPAYEASFYGGDDPKRKGLLEFSTSDRELGAKSESFPELWKKTDEYLIAYNKRMIHFDKKPLFENNLSLFAKEALLYQKIIIAIALQFVVISPTLNYFFPQGLLQSKAPKKPIYLNGSTANNYITKLKQYHADLSKIAKRNIKLARYSLPVLIAIAIYLFNTLSLEAPQLFACFLSLFVTALTGLQKELVDLFKKRSLNKNIAQAQKNISKALEGFPCEIELERFSSFELTYFIINFNGFKPSADKEKLTGKVMASLFSKCCYINHIELISQRSNSLALSADKLLDYKKLNLVRELFIQAVEREVFIQILRNQLNRLMAAFKAKCLNLSMTFEPGHDNANLPWLKIELSLDGLQQISEDQKNKLEDLLTTLFADLDCKIDKSDESFEISLEGFKSLDEKVLKQVIDEINRISVKIDRPNVNEENLAQSGSSKKLKKPKMEMQKNKAEVPVRDLRERVIEWPSGRYDSQDRNSKVHLFPFGNFESTRNYEKARIFFTHQINPKKIPVEDLILKDKIFDKLEHLLEAPKIVPAKGHQGFVFWQGMANDLNGRPFQASVKGKLLGEFGDVRFYGEAEKSATGETLYVIKGIEPHAH